MNDVWLVSYLALWILFLLVAVALLVILRNLGIIYQTLGDSHKSSLPYTAPTKLSPGEELPELHLQTLSGDHCRISEFRRTKTAFMVLSPTCSPCHDLLNEVVIGARQPDPLDPAVRQVVVVSTGDPALTSRITGQLRLPSGISLLVDPEHSVAKRWGITSTPATVIVDDHFRVVRQIFGLSQEPLEGGVNIVGSD